MVELCKRNYFFRNTIVVLTGFYKMCLLKSCLKGAFAAKYKQSLYRMHLKKADLND